jgi:chemotaxis protein histidine kinase CheA
MVNALDMTRLDRGPETAIDTAVLNQILDIGDAGLRDALLAQLVTDFRRISAALSEGTGDELGAVAHELKGLAATIGANRLAQLAKRLNTVADCAVPAELSEFRAPVEGEIRIVLDTLARHAGTVRS